MSTLAADPAGRARFVRWRLIWPLSLARCSVHSDLQLPWPIAVAWEAMGVLCVCSPVGLRTPEAPATCGARFQMGGDGPAVYTPSRPFSAQNAP